MWNGSFLFRAQPEVSMCNFRPPETVVNTKPLFQVTSKWFGSQLLPVNVTGPEGTQCIWWNEIVVAVFVKGELVYYAKGFSPCGAV